MNKPALAYTAAIIAWPVVYLLWNLVFSVISVPFFLPGEKQEEAYDRRTIRADLFEGLGAAASQILCIWSGKIILGYLGGEPSFELVLIYDAAIFSFAEYRRKLDIPQLFFMPAIDPFSITNRELSEKEIDERLDHYDIPTDLPLVVQISRFDRWKDPEGVIRAFKIARREVDATLVLLGNVATDDPEGEEVYQSLLDQREERIIILSKEDTSLVNALQSRAAVVLQKSLREGFGLTVAEAMWKKTPVIGGGCRRDSVSD